jgi:UDP-N-acetylglucosamine 4,6-dehydratase
MSKYLIFGGTGSLGKKLIERFSTDNELSIYSRDEMKHWTCKNDLQNRRNIIQPKFYVGDIRDQSRVRDVLQLVKPNIIIIAAALKQVDTCELSPDESIQTNLVGTQNIINAIINSELTQRDSNIESVLFVSTDKACAPVNVYGMCKALSERVVTSQAQHAIIKTKFLCTRYGNVLESRGSIIPLFKYQAENNQFLTVTDPTMTRFLMTLDDSVDLIENTLAAGKSGETWIPRLPAMMVGDLARIFADRSGKEIKIIGLRPGEKKHEDLINESESVRTEITQKHYIINPAYTPGSKPRFTYSSCDDLLTKDDLHKHLSTLGIIDIPIGNFDGHRIEEIMTNRNE